MAKTKHTPGPWSAQLNAPTAAIPGHLIEAGDVRHPVALLWEGVGTKGKPRQIANAHLIAAAPELLDALRAAVLNCPHDEDCDYIAGEVAVADDCDCWKANARAAIAKAEGRP